MLSRQQLFRSRATARAAKPEPHQRLTSAVLSAETFAATAPLIDPIEVELMAMVVDIADDTLENLQMKREVGKTDVANGVRVLAAARIVMAHSPADSQHIDTLIERVDDLYARLCDIQTEEREYAAR